MNIRYIEKKKEICWLLVLMILLQQFVSVNAYLVICLLFTGFFCIKYVYFINRYLPKGFGLYFFWGVIALFLGIINGANLWRLLRATSYWLNGIVAVVFGVVIVRATYKKYDLIKSLVIAHLFITIYCFIELCMSGGFLNYMTLRSSLSANIEGLEFLFPIYIVNKFVYREVIVSRKTDFFITLLFVLRIAISFSRTTIIGAGMGIVVYFFIMEKRYRCNVSLLMKILLIVILIIFFIYVLAAIMPEGTSDFLNKFSTIFNEIETDGVFDSYSMALGNWRGYENQQAIEQWFAYDISEKIFGSGFGGLIYMKYISTAWATMEFYKEGGIPLLHNGYLTILCLGGLLGVFVYIRFLLKNIQYAILNRANKYVFRDANMMIILILMMALNTFVTRGLYSSDIYLTWGILFGLFIYRIKRSKLKENYIDDKKN